jgi:hypothetical protein
MGRQTTYQVDGILIGSTSVALLLARDGKAGHRVSLPDDAEDGFVGVSIDSDHDLLNQCPKKLLAVLVRSSWGGPESRQILA